jgi:hypothetical protein
MSFDAIAICNARSDDDLYRVLQANLDSVFPAEVLQDQAIFLSQLRTAPRGLRAMAATYDLDVSMALDDLAWHFTNHPDIAFAEETLLGLRELEATEAADIFEKALSIIEPHLLELKEFLASDNRDINDWLESKGIQAQMDPLNRQMWKLLDDRPREGLFKYWYAYARKYPERCVA